MRFYYTKTITRVINPIFAALYAAIFIGRLFVYDMTETFDAILTYLWLIVILVWVWILFRSYSFKIYINNSGVKFTKRKRSFAMEWKDIKSISLVGYNKTTNIEKSIIFFES